MEIVARCLILYLLITFGSIGISSKTNKKIEKSIPIYMCLVILTLYVFGIFNFLKIGFYFVCFLSIILGIIGIKKQKTKIVDLVATPGFAFFSIVYFVLMITTYNKQLVDWDHFTYRSLNAKIMYYTDTMVKGYDYFYPPAATLIEYFFMNVIGMYRQGIEAFAMQIFGISLLLPMFDNVRPKKHAKIAKISVALIIICIPAVFINLIFYESAYQDATLGLLLGYILYMFFSNSSLKYKILSIGLAMSILVLTKPSGIGIAAILIAIFIIYEFFNNRYILKRKTKALLKNKNLIIIIAITLIVLTIFASWKIVQKVYEKDNKVSQIRQTELRVEEQAKSPIEYVYKSIITTILGKSEENNDAANSNGDLIYALYRTYGLYTPIKLSLAATSILFIIAYAYYYYKIKDEKFKFQSIAIVIGLVLYILFLQLSYLLKFSKEEMIGHNGIDRYYATFLLGMLYYIYAVVIHNLNKKEYEAKKYFAILLIILLITPLNSVSNVTITSGIYNINSTQYINSAKNIAEEINEYVQEDSKIITISQTEDTKLFNIMLKYYLYPEYNANVINNVGDNNIEYIKKLSETSDYIYIFSKDDKLNKILNKIFSNIEKVENNTLYKIQNNNGNMSLIKQKHIDEII